MLGSFFKTSYIQPLLMVNVGNLSDVFFSARCMGRDCFYCTLVFVSLDHNANDELK